MLKEKCGYNLIELFLIGLLVVMVVLTIWAVFARYVLNISPRWTEELSRFIYIWITFLGAFVVLTKDRHVSIDTFIERLPQRLFVAVDRVNVVLMLTFLFAMVRGGLQVSKMAMSQIAPGTGIRIGYVYTVIPISGTLMFVYRVLNRLRGSK